MAKTNNKIQRNRGMTYVEIIVVLSIFATMNSIVLFKYKDFQARVDIKNLANDIAIKIVQAQKAAVSGVLPVKTTASNWKPTYGVHFDLGATNNKSFIYFTDFNPQDGLYLGSFSCSSPTGLLEECIEKTNITKGNYISEIRVAYTDASFTTIPTNSNLSLTFTRPDSGLTLKSSVTTLGVTFPISYVRITISSPSLITAQIEAYPSGRIQIK